MRAVGVAFGLDRRLRVWKSGKLVPVSMGGIVAGGLPIVEEGDDMAVVGFVDAGHTPAAKQLALEAPKNSHGSCLDTAIAFEV
jgi:hypothetical protein